MQVATIFVASAVMLIVAMVEAKRILCCFRGHIFRSEPFECTTVKIEAGEPVILHETAKVDSYMQCKRCGCMNPEYVEKIAKIYSRQGLGIVDK